MRPLFFIRAGNIIFSVIIVILLIQVIELNIRHAWTQANHEIVQEISGVTFRIWKGRPGRAVLIVGDLLGVNFLADRILEASAPAAGFEESRIVITVNKPVPPAGITAENFFDVISTDSGIVLPDNFCVRGWERVRDKEIYRRTSLSPGNYCFSEPACAHIDRLIKTFNVQEAIVFYDAKPYLDLIDTFLLYLDESRIPYRLIKSDDIRR